MFWVGRAISHLVLGGVFQRFPDLKFVITETGCSWVLPELQKLDGEIRFGKTPGQGQVVFGDPPVQCVRVADDSGLRSGKVERAHLAGQLGP